MAKALGVGGIFFKSENPKRLIEWYKQWLGMTVDEWNSVLFKPDGMPAGSYTVWGPFDNSTSYFEPSSKEYMFNIVVDDLDGALAQVREGGAKVIDDTKEYEFGRFGWFLDPEGNKVELWEPRVA